ncbi:MAG: hypothetical protein ACKVU2_02970 [Saprospiraceae bacterium]
MKNTFLLLFCFTTTIATSQAELKRAYKPTTVAPSTSSVATPVTYSTESPAPTMYSTEVESRRAAALAKVQGTQGGSTAKGLRPSEYNTSGGTSPAMYSTTSAAAPDPSTTVTVNGLNVQRNVRKGRGQVGNDLFTPVSELHYVQFAVYCRDTPVDKAPSIGGLYLLWHPGSTCPGGEKGASYIVKGYTTADEAKAAVLSYKANRVDCWYNPALTGAEVEIIGVR